MALLAPIITGKSEEARNPTVLEPEHLDTAGPAGAAQGLHVGMPE
jgi:hypothetical protein